MAKRLPLSRGFVEGALRRQAVWDVGNRALYELCERHPFHQDAANVIAKVWLIGRSYAASIERRREHLDVDNDDFYVKHVAPTICRSRIDDWLVSLRVLPGPDAAAVIPVHRRITLLFESISGLEKRSLASKYLHFHCPHAAYIYDARAAVAIRRVSPPLRRSLECAERDEEYARFYQRCETFRADLERVMERAMTPREVDSVLLAVAAGGE